MSQCANCQADAAKKRCSACKAVSYCNKDCQKAHFKEHKKQCATLAKASATAQADKPDDITPAAAAARQHGLEMDDEDITQLKADFDIVVKKYDLQGDRMSGRIADYLTSHTRIDTAEFAKEFGMEMKDANTMLMWIQIGTSFKTDVIDRNAQLAREGKL